MTARKANPGSVKADLLALVLKRIAGRYETGPKKDARGIALFKLKDFSGKASTTAVLYSPRTIRSQRALLVGLGERKKASLDVLRKAAALTASTAVDLKASSLAVFLHDGMFEKDFSVEAVGQALAEGLYFGAYRYDEYLSDKPSEKRLDQIRADRFVSNPRAAIKPRNSNRPFWERPDLCPHAGQSARNMICRRFWPQRPKYPAEIPPSLHDSTKSSWLPER